MRNVSSETHLRFCERKIWFSHAQESNHDLKRESNPLPLVIHYSLIIIELNLVQVLESAIHWSDGYTMLIGSTLRTC